MLSEEHKVKYLEQAARLQTAYAKAFGKFKVVMNQTPIGPLTNQEWLVDNLASGRQETMLLKTQLILLSSLVTYLVTTLTEDQLSEMLSFLEGEITSSVEQLEAQTAENNKPKIITKLN